MYLSQPHFGDEEIGAQRGDLANVTLLVAEPCHLCFMVWSMQSSDRALAHSDFYFSQC